MTTFEFRPLSSPVLRSRNLSEESGICQPASTSMPKPCLKRRSSAKSDDSCYGSVESGSLSTVSSADDCRSLLSQKSVSFADSIGEDLVHIRTFSKDWTENQNLNLWESYDIEEEHEEDEDCDYFLTPYTFDLDDEDFGLRMITISDVMERVAERADPSERLAYPSEQLAPPARPSTIMPTFVSPRDLEDFSHRLSKTFIKLEDVLIEPPGLITGSIRVNKDSLCNLLGSPIDYRDFDVCVRYTFDTWKSSADIPTSCSEFAESYSFDVDVSCLRSGEDFELVVLLKTKEGTEEIVDDNDGVNYRFICKDVNKFKPGKSLW